MKLNMILIASNGFNFLNKGVIKNIKDNKITINKRQHRRTRFLLNTVHVLILGKLEIKIFKQVFYHVDPCRMHPVNLNLNCAVCKKSFESIKLDINSFPTQFC